MRPKHKDFESSSGSIATCDGISITVVLCGSLRTRIIIIGRRQALNHLQLVIQKRSRRFRRRSRSRRRRAVINGANWI